MKRLFLPLVLALVAGCLSPAPKAPTNWTIEIGCRPDLQSSQLASRRQLRLNRVRVRAPFAGRRIAVLRDDGSVAFDSYNVFAAAPALLLTGAALDAVNSSPDATCVLLSEDSSARCKESIEITVSTFALDCRQGRRDARVALEVALLSGRDLVANGAGTAAVPVTGDFSQAFSSAYAAALAEAFGKLVR